MKKNIYILSALAVSLLLQACIPAAFVAGAASGLVIYDQREAKTIFDDRDITYLTQTAINSDKELKAAAHVSVTTFNHVVLVVGQTPTPELRDKAIAIVQKTANISKVHNAITIEPSISMQERSRDAWLTTKVKTALLAEKGLHSPQIKIVTENKTVYLLGIVSNSQGQLAADVAKNVAGIEKVVKVFEYIN